MFIAVGILIDKNKAPLWSRSRTHELGTPYTDSVITVVSKVNPMDLAVVLHGQGTALPTKEISEGDI